MAWSVIFCNHPGHRSSHAGAYVAVQRDAERGEKVITEVLDMVRGTKLDTGTYLNKPCWPARGRGAWDVAPASAAPLRVRRI